MKETTKRIEAYKAALPGLKERLAAVALLLVISMIMMIASTFAWVTLSRSPELNGLSTSISGNGNLEIALSNPEGTMPGEFDVDDSVIREVNVSSSNLQWGNLINLTDSSYGIQNMVLRPAQLNTANLLSSPLWGAQYGADGRVETMNSNFAFASYDGNQFVVNKEAQYGIRAIASYTASVSDTKQQEIDRMNQAVLEAHNHTSQSYSEVRSKFDALGSMVSVYAQDIVNNINQSDKKYSDLGGYLGDMLPLYETLYNAMLTQQDSFVALRNLQLYIEANNAGQEFKETDIVTWEDISENVSQHQGAGKLTGLEEYIKDLKALKADLEHLQKYYQDRQANGTPYYWYTGGDSGYQISDMIQRLIEFSTMTADLGSGEVVLSQLGGDIGKLIGALGGGEKDVYLHGGIMYRFEQSSVNPDYRLNGKAACTIKIQYGFSVTVKGRAQTKASGACTFQNDWSNTQGVKVIPSDAVAEDTYGMAVDFWVRSNAESTFLILEGAIATDINSQEMRYDGVNRVWGYTNTDGTGLPTLDSTSQGSGSCYIFYADTPEDQARSLSLLEAMKVAFVSADGTLLATAEMDTEHYVAVNGRVTVPMVLDESSLKKVNKDAEDSEKIKAISQLTYDEAQRITAIIYLDGTSLSNDDVLAASEIQGQLNIQFGSSENLQTIGDNDLKNAERKVSAELDTTAEDKLNCQFAYEDRDAKPLKVTVLLDIVGTDATDVRGFFMRAITSSQGSREAEMTFTKLGNGQWSAEYQFTAPGTYYLRDVQVNGVNYHLEDPIKVEITGFGLKNISWSESGDHALIRTSDGTHSTSIKVEFASYETAAMPHAVQARFVRSDGNTINVPLAYNGGGEWVGTTTFSTSGTYKLQYLVYTVRNDGVEESIYYGLSENFVKTIDLSLGLYVVVTNMSGQETVDFESGKTYEWDVLVDIFDNAGNRLEDLENVSLCYSNNGSVSNTVSVGLTPEYNQYIGTVVVDRAGRWIFGYVQMEGQTLTKATSSPVFTIISPDPVVFDESSVSSYYGRTQYSPLTNDAFMDGIKIANSDAATIRAIVYNKERNEYHTVEVPSHSNDKVSISLPSYTTGKDADGKDIYSQDGTWELVALMLTNCYAEDKQFHDETNPVVWANQAHKTYFDSLTGENAVNITAYMDFSRMTTTVSSTLNVTMEPGNTALGGSNYEFMHQFALKDIGMQVKLTDASGNQIPASEVPATITLKVQYSPDNAAKYGYAVSGYGYTGTISLTNVDPENGTYVVSDGQSVWQYVGEYMVQSLTVTIGGQTVTLSPGTNGVPAKYTVTTATYNVQDITLTDTNQVIKQFGKTGESISGTFLQSYSMEGTNMKLSLGTKDVNGNQFVALETKDVSATLKLTHKGGNEANGGYSFTASEYQNLSLPMTNTNGVYKPGSTVLLAGTYGVQIEYTIGGITQTVPLDDISVYSKKPDVTMALGSGTPTTVTAITGGGLWYQETFTANNQISNNGHSALLFVAAMPSTSAGSHTGGGFIGIGSHTKKDTTQSGNLADYTLPKLMFNLTNGGTTCTNFTLTIPNNGTNATFASGSGSSTVELGSIETATIKQKAYCSDCGADEDYTYATEKANVIGTQTISTITAVCGNDTYSIKLDTPLSIVNENKAAPSVSFDMTENPGFTAPTGQSSSDGYKFIFTLPSELKTASGVNAVVQSREEKESSLESSSGDLSSKLPSLSSILDTDWQDIAGTSTTKNIYTETCEIKSSIHYHSVVSWPADYYKHYEQTKYDVKNVRQTVSYTVTVDGTITNTNTTYVYEDTITLEAWVVDGVRYALGAQVEITGNSIVTPVYRTTSKLVKKTVETSTTVGTFSAIYSTTCAAVITTQNGSAITGDLSHYCVKSGSCKQNYPAKGSEAAAKAAAEADATPAVAGYTLTSETVTTGTVRDFSESQWVQDGDAVMNGETTTTTVVYDGEGNVIG